MNTKNLSFIKRFVKDYTSEQKIVIFASTVFYIGIVIFLGLLSESGIDQVFVGMLPLLLYLVVFVICFIERKLNNEIIMILPLLFPSLYLAIYYSRVSNFISSMNGIVVAVLNVLLSYAGSAIFIFLYNQETRRKLSKKQYYNDLAEYYKQRDVQYSNHIQNLNNKIQEYKEKLEISDNNFNVHLRSIEDKCKSLNFVIGRVYSDKKGGSKNVREMLRIEKELYNAFSELSKNFEEKDAGKLLRVLENMYQKLRMLELSEKDIIRFKQSIDINRDEKGNDRIIDVLARNDKDPVMDYYGEALEVCSKLINFFKTRYPEYQEAA